MRIALVGESAFGANPREDRKLTEMLHNCEAAAQDKFEVQG
jgi:hypothetical protein